ncbi:hypothetical protein DL765_009146 [Monosporascus sp. GIB2]|nr:hypothetical protein DL765_009146 [Monosporascus sp. GIB2]
MSIDFATLELDSLESAGLKSVPMVLEEFQRRIGEPDITPDAEWAVVDGKMLISRYHFIRVANELKAGDSSHETGVVLKLEQEKLGLADTLFWKPSIETALADDEVRVEVRAVGLNFKDVLISSGAIVEPSSIGRGMGYECSGVITAVGPLVTKHCIGDRVIVSGTGGFFATSVQRSQHVWKMPDSMTFEEGATFPVVYFAAIYSLLDCGHLVKGMSVLIHSAAGGVGIAAIQIAKMVGAEIYCTVSNEEKIQFLMTEFGIPRVDVVLNSLAGEMLHASWKCVAEFGTFIEIGRRDFVGQGTLAMELFESNRTFVGCSSPPSGLASATEAIHKPHRLRDDAAYLFVGGLGGLGRSVTTFLIEKGARHFIFLSRTAGDMSDDDPFVCELEAQDCVATRVSGDVNNYDDVVKAIRTVAMPIAGVLQASMVLRDNSLVDMSWDQWVTATKPKIQGTWNLHNALLREQAEPLDLFFLFSSAGAMTGQWGQANYNAGSTFLDAFVSYRHSLGLPASVVNIGVIGDVGYVSKNSEVLDTLRATSQYIMGESALLDSIELMLKRSVGTANTPQGSALRSYVQRSQIGIGMRSLLPITSPANRTNWRKDPRMLVYRNLEAADAAAAGSSASSDEELTQFLRDVASNMTMLKSAESAALIAREVGKTLAGYLMRSDDELDIGAPLSSVGIDSLISIELRNWIRRRLGADITVLEIVRAESVEHLGEKIQGKLVEKYLARAG